MSTEKKNVEVFVGLFLLMGFSAIAIMVVVFGRVGQSLQKTYPITVIFPNASGLVKGSDVLLAG
ncbi:MAG: MCE family protein, partial [Verrucomicrobiota bacterium]